MAVGAPPLPPQPSIGRVNPNGTPTQAQIDYERQFSKWVSDYIASVVGGALPFPTPTTLGGVKSATAPTHQFQRGIDGTGSPLFGQPAAADITGLGPFAIGTTVPAPSVTGLATVATSGLASDLIGSLSVGPPTPTTLGGVYSSDAPTFTFCTGVDTLGNLQYREPTFHDIADQVLNSQMPFPGGGGTLGGVKSLRRAASGPHAFLTEIDEFGNPFAIQPDFTDFSGNIAVSQMNSGTSASASTFWRGDGAWAGITAGNVSGLATVATSGSAADLTGTLALARLGSQSANQVLAGPSSGAAANPTFRALVGADLPNPSATTLGGVQSKAAVASNWLTSISTSGVPAASQPAFTDISGSVAASQLNGLSNISNSLGANVLLTNVGLYFDGPSIAQGTSGTWFASGTVTLSDAAGAAIFVVRLWDGTTTIGATVTQSPVGNYATATLSGVITSPAGNLRISVKDISSASGKILWNDSGLSKDSTISALRIG